MDANELLKMLSDGDRHSPASLQAALGAGPGMIDEWLRRFQDHGLEIIRSADGGVSLSHPLSLLDRRLILTGLVPALADNLQHLELPLIVDSTNTRATEWLHDGNRGLALFLAEQQQNGRGRRGRSWVSPMARNLTLSLVWPIADIRQAQEGFSLVVALSLVESMQAMGLKGSDKLRVKWPNDVWLGAAKLAGILLELHGGSAGPHHVIIGIGMNVHMPAQALADIEQPVGDLYSEGNRHLNRNQLVTGILNSLAQNLATLEREGFAFFRQRWLELDVFRHRQVEVSGHGEPAVGIVKGVSDGGALILETAQGERQFTGGEIAPTVRPLDTGRAAGAG